MSRSFKHVLLGAAAASLLLVPRAMAQDYRDTAYAPGPETVIVTAPQFREDRSTPLGAPDKVSLSQTVAYDDLDLTTRDGAHELRARVRDAARDVCRQLHEAVSVPQLTGTHCYREAMQNGLVRADAAIRNARYDDGQEDRY